MNSPCKQNGIDCPDRKVGCRSTCTHGWDKYQQQCEKRRQARIEDSIVFDGTVIRREERVCRSLKRKPKGKC